MKRGEIWWATLGRPHGSEPGYRRPVIIVQADQFNRSRMNTTIIATVTTNMRLANMPGNVTIHPNESGLPTRSVINVTQLAAADRTRLTERVGTLSRRRLTELNAGLKLALGLE